MHDADLSQKLLYAESGFLDALEGGTETLISFGRSLSTLPDVALKARGVSDETLCLAHSTASRILIIANCFLDACRAKKPSTDSLYREWDSLVRRMTSLDINESSTSFKQPESRDGNPRSSMPTPSTEGPSPQFLASAYQWLMNNLHNPYPAAEVKARLAADSSCKVSSVNSWFVNARRRIGWTTLCRERFANSRANVIIEAHRALVQEDPQVPAALRHSFMAIKVAAESLYPTTLTKSVFISPSHPTPFLVVDRGHLFAGE